MTKLKRIGILVVAFLFSITNVIAADTCSYEEKAKLNSEAANVKVNHEIKQRVLDPSEYDLPDALIGASEEEIEEFRKNVTTEYMVVNILNLTENLYVEVTNNVNQEKRVYTYADSTDGNITFRKTGISGAVTYTIKIYSSANTNCKDTGLGSLYVTLPRYNPLSEYAICESIPEYYMCQKYVTFEDPGFDTFMAEAQKEVSKVNTEKEEENKKNDKWYKEAGKFIENHKVAFIVGGVVLLVAAGAVTIIIIKRRRRSVI